MPPKKLKTGDRKRTGDLTFNAGPEPAFLRNFKARVGHKSDTSKLQDKFEAKQANEIQDNLSKDALHQEDEMPQVVIPTGEDILPNEVDSYFLMKKKEVDDDKADLQDSKLKEKHKLIFRKKVADGDRLMNSLYSESDKLTVLRMTKNLGHIVSGLILGLKLAQIDPRWSVLVLNGLF